MNFNIEEAVDIVEGEISVKDQKNARWKKDRCGKITASPSPKIMKGTAKEYFSKTGLSELLYTKFERRTGILRTEIRCSSFDFGHENEPFALDKYREEFPDLIIKSCSDDFDDIMFIVPEEFDGKFGDSPDAYVYDKEGVLIAVAEVKCNVSESKFESLRDVKEITNKHEYWWQFIAHLVCHPTVDRLVWLNYCPTSDELHHVELLRYDCLDAIAEFTKKIKLANEWIDMCIADEALVFSGINKWCNNGK